VSVWGGARFTIRSMIIAVALVGLNLAGAIAMWNSIPPPEQAVTLRIGPQLRPADDEDGDRNLRLELGRFATGEALVRVVRGARQRPNLMEIWSPLIASASLTLLVVTVATERAAYRHRVNSSPAGSYPLSQLHGVFTKVRRATIVAALVALNVVAAIHRPLPVPRERGRTPNEFFDLTGFFAKDGSHFFKRPDGGLVIRRADGTRECAASPNDTPLPLDPSDGRSRVLETIFYRSDGSIVAYDGSPGLIAQVFSWPRVIHPPTRSPMEMWWPVAASALITILVLELVRRQERQSAEAVREVEGRLDGTDMP
jgi:hypothetical protein